MMLDVREIYSKGYDDGQRAIVRALRDIIDDAPQPGYSGLTRYYKHSIEILLEVYSHGKEEKEEN